MTLSETSKPIDSYHKQTRFFLLLSSILKEPLFSLYGLAAFILRKDLNATAFQIAVLTMLRPMISILSYYWSSYVSDRRGSLKSNFLWAGFLSSVLFLFFPFINNPWFVIVAVSLYIMFYRAGVPAWMEILKLNIPKTNRESLFSWSSSIGYMESILLAVGLGYLLEISSNMWKLLFFVAAVIGMVNVYVLSKVPVNYKKEKKEKIRMPLVNRIKQPWQDSFNLVKNNQNFAKFQIGYMICGFGLMLVQPIIPIFCVDKLNLSHHEFAIGMLVCKGMGFVISSPIWGRLMSKISIMKLSSYSFIATALFMLLLMFSTYSLFWFYFAFTVYGVMQGGSHLLWNLSGTIFAGEENSSKYSSVNVVMVALRGSIAPPLGGLLAIFMGPYAILSLGISFCLYSSFQLMKGKVFILEKLGLNK